MPTLDVPTASTRLIHAVTRREVETIQYLLEVESADPNFKAHHGYGWNSFHEAANGGQVKIAVLLLVHGADINAPADDGKTALHLAACAGNDVFLDFLLSQGANTELRIGGGNTALHCAVQSPHVSTRSIETLIRYGANIEARTTGGKTPLHVAVECGSTALGLKLLELGADWNALDNAGQTPIRYADLRRLRLKKPPLSRARLKSLLELALLNRRNDRRCGGVVDPTVPNAGTSVIRETQQRDQEAPTEGQNITRNNAGTVNTDNVAGNVGNAPANAVNAAGSRAIVNSGAATGNNATAILGSTSASTNAAVSAVTANAGSSATVNPGTANAGNSATATAGNNVTGIVNPAGAIGNATNAAGNTATTTIPTRAPTQLSIRARIERLHGVTGIDAEGCCRARILQLELELIGSNNTGSILQRLDLLEEAVGV